MLLIGISCAWIAGIWLGSQFNVPAFYIFSAILPVFFLLVFKKLHKLFILLTVGLLFLFAGTWLSPILSHQDNSIAAYNNLGSIEFSGTVSEPPVEQNTKSQIVISIKEVNGHPAEGKALYGTYSNSTLEYGDVLRGKGIFQLPPTFEDFDYRSYLAGEGIYSVIQEMDCHIVERGSGSPLKVWIFDLRQNLADSLSSVMPEPQASLCQGIILGIRGNISPDLKRDLALTGSAHLLAISGLNLTIIAGLLTSLGLLVFGRRYYLYIWLTLCIIWFYSFLTGLQAPVIRSAIMASLFLFAEILGRQKNAFPALTLSAAIMVAFSPQVLGNLSFQLSFLAMVGLIFITPVLSQLARKAVYARFGEEGIFSKSLTTVTDSFSVSLGAVIAVWPLIALYFKIVSLAGLLTTFLISPALSPIIIFGTLTALIGLFSTAVAQVIGWIAWIYLSYMIIIAQVFAVVPLAYIETKNFNSLFIWLHFGLLILLINSKMVFNKMSVNWFREIWSKLISWGESGGDMIGRKAKWIVTPLLMIAILTSLAAVTLPERNLKVSFLNVGEGESCLIQTGGQNILIDGGPDGQSVCLELGKLLPFWERKIDLVILTHPHLDHLTGLIEILKRYRVGKVLAPSALSDLPSYQEWLQLTKAKNIEYISAYAFQHILLNHDVVLDVLNPPWLGSAEAMVDLDKNAIVLRLLFGNYSFLFTSDIGIETETRLLRDRLITQSDILKIGHHGSNTSSSTLFLKSVNPSMAVISVGKGNSFGHPAKAVLDRITASGIKTIYRTDLNGTITFIMETKGSRIWIKTEQ